MPKQPLSMRQRMVRSNCFYSKTPFLSTERFINYITLKRCYDNLMYTPRVVLLYVGDPIELPHHSKIKSLMELSYEACGPKQLQYIYDNRESFPEMYKLLLREHHTLKKRLHQEFFHFDDIYSMRFVRDLCFPKL